MGKKNYFIISATILVFLIAIVAILLTGNKNKENWITSITKAQDYQITMIDCNGREKKLEKNTINTIADKLNKLSNNGPWTGNTSACYTKVNISYENNGIIREIQILLIDQNSLVLDLGTSTIYYTNGEEIINYLNSLFIA